MSVVRRFIPTEEELEIIDHHSHKNGLEKIQTLLLNTMFSENENRPNQETYLLLNDPIFYSIYIKEMTAVLAPKIEQFLILGNQDQSLQVPQPKQLAEIIILLISTWFIPELYPNTAETFWDKVVACQYVLKQSGVDILNDRVLKYILAQLTEKRR